MKDKKGLSIITLVIGIISVLISCCGGGFVGIASIITGVIALKKEKKNAMSIIGIVLSGIAIIVSVIVTIVFGVSFFSGRQRTEPINNETSNVGTDYTYEDNYETDTNSSADNSATNMSEVQNVLLVGETGLQGDVVIGNVVTFGAYEQDNDLSNGLEPIEWEVIDIQDGRALLLSRYVLDNRSFNVSSDNDTWSDSEIREWLNNDFYNAAFNVEEQNMIRSTLNESEYYVVGEYMEETIDDVFLLSNGDLKKYYSYEVDNYTSTISVDENYVYGTAVTCHGTEYAVAQGLYIAENGCCHWWLRSAGHGTGDEYSKFVNSEGIVGEIGTSQMNRSGIRPAIWVSCDGNIENSATNAEIWEQIESEEQMAFELAENEKVLWKPNEDEIYNNEIEYYSENSNENEKYYVEEWYEIYRISNIGQQTVIVNGDYYIVSQLLEDGSCNILIMVYRENKICEFIIENCESEDREKYYALVGIAELYVEEDMRMYCDFIENDGILIFEILDIAGWPTKEESIAEYEANGYTIIYQ